MCFSSVKAHYKKAKLNALLNDKPFDQKAAITAAFRSLKKKSIAKCIRHANDLISNITQT